MKYQIGTKLIDKDKNIGIVGIQWNDGDFCTIENDTAHPEPQPITNDDDLEDYIKNMLLAMKQPRLICICKNFKWSGHREMDWFRCKCGGWMSGLQLIEKL